MNIADLVTQVQEEEEEQPQQQQQPQHPAQAQAIQPPNGQSESSLNDEDEPVEHSFCYRLLCCLLCKPKPTPSQQDDNASSVPMQTGVGGGKQAASNAQASRADDAGPSISASGVTMGIQRSSTNGAPGPAKGQATGAPFPSSAANSQSKPPPAQPYPAHADPLPPLRESNNIVTPPPSKYLLGPLAPQHVGKKCLVLDLDETLVHSSFKPIPNADFVISIELENVIHRV